MKRYFIKKLTYEKILNKKKLKKSKNLTFTKITKKLKKLENLTRLFCS